MLLATRIHVINRSGETFIICCQIFFHDISSYFQIYPYELEKVKEFGEFSDVVETFPLSKGKHFEDVDDDDDDIIGTKRFCGKVKVNKYQTISY